MIIAIAHNQMLEWAGAYRGSTPTFTDLAWQMDLQDWVAGILVKSNMHYGWRKTKIRGQKMLGAGN